MNAESQETLAQAERLADSLRLLATEYQAVVRSTQKTDPGGATARRSLDRRFQKLKAREKINALRERGHPDAAEKLDDLFGAAAMVFNLVAVSIGVDEAEVLDIDVNSPHVAAVKALKQVSGT